MASGPSVKLVRKFGRKLLHLGTFLLTIGIIGLIFTIYYYGTGINSWQIAPNLLICGLGMGFTAPMLTNVILSGVPTSDAGSASGVLNTVSQLGGAIGVAVIGVVFFGLLATQGGACVNDITPQIQVNLESAGIPVPMQKKIIENFKSSYEKYSFSMGAPINHMNINLDENQKESNVLTVATSKSVKKIIDLSVNEVIKLNFSRSFRYTLLYEVTVFLLSFILIFLLPKKVQGH